MFGETKYALGGDLMIAYRATAPGPRDILFASNRFGNVEFVPEMPSFRSLREYLEKVGRVIHCDQPGSGAPDPISIDSPPTLEQWSDVTLAVLDAVGSRDAVVLGNRPFCASSFPSSIRGKGFSDDDRCADRRPRRALVSR